jgi:hypothetical protein
VAAVTQWNREEKKKIKRRKKYFSEHLYIDILSTIYPQGA